MALVRWLESHNVLPSDISYYQDKESQLWSGRYFQFPLEVKEFIQQIGSEANPNLQRFRIAEQDSKNQNIFHKFFSSYFFPLSEIHKKPENYFILSEDRPLVFLSNSTYSRIELRRNHKELKKNGKLHKPSDLIKKNEKRIINAFLTPFQNQNAELLSALVCKDKDNNTPIFYVFKHKILSEETLRIFFQRINEFTPEEKNFLVCERNEFNLTIFHMIVAQDIWSLDDVKQFITLFGPRAVKNALCYLDVCNNTILHNVFLHKKETWGDLVVLICELAKSAEIEAKDFSVETFFCQNKSRLNPFHLVFREHDKSALKTLEALFSVLPKELHFIKMIEQDQRSRAPIYYAVKANNIDAVNRMLDPFSEEQQTKIAVIKNKEDETILHDACRSGNTKIIERIIRALGPRELYRIRCETPELEESIPADARAAYRQAVNHANKLFNCFHYFVKNLEGQKNVFSRLLNQNWGAQEDFKIRLGDFLMAFQAIEAKRCLPAEDPRISPKTYFGIQGGHTYHDLRALLTDVSEREIKEFREFINHNVSNAPKGQLPTDVPAPVYLSEQLGGIKNSPNTPPPAYSLLSSSGVVLQQLNASEDKNPKPVVSLDVAPPSYHELMMQTPCATVALSANEQEEVVEVARPVLELPVAQPVFRR